MKEAPEAITSPTSSNKSAILDSPPNNLSHHPQDYSMEFSELRVKCLRYAISRNGSSPANEDDVQDALLRVWERITRISGGQSGREAYAITSVKNRAIERYRANKRSRDKLFEEDERTTRASDTEDSAAITHDLTKAFSKVTAGQRQVLVLAGLGYEYSEIAAAMDLSERTVPNKLSKARFRLRGLLGEVPRPLKEVDHEGERNTPRFKSPIGKVVKSKKDQILELTASSNSANENNEGISTSELVKKVYGRVTPPNRAALIRLINVINTESVKTGIRVVNMSVKKGGRSEGRYISKRIQNVVESNSNVIYQPH